MGKEQADISTWVPAGRCCRIACIDEIVSGA
jgi:hypothetical protein